ncbi:MAG: acyl-CoA dehydrogenase [Dermatophilus congolensis]|nr:acyl-CoA dehydrogenase [Dermatophilus congolensis]
MSHYKSNLRDLEFALFEVFERDKLLTDGTFGDIDADTARELLHEASRLAENELAAGFADDDRNPPVFDPATNTVVMPESFKKEYKAFVDSGFAALPTIPELGGTPMPPSIQWGVAEMILGANPAAFMYSAGFGFAGILHELGTADQKKIAQHMVDREWGATMVLTEPEAGSDVGAGRTKAVQQPDGTWHITGTKRFITSAEHDLMENIVHLVLARPEGAGPGTKGLSLFCVPKYHVDIESGDLGERNGVYVTNVEHKMGLKVSTTCEVAFGEKEPAVGTLVGDVHNGIAQMFHVIEYARMFVGAKAIATLSTGYLNALEYAKTRLQGQDLAQSMDKSAPRVPIIRHPDVRRSLMLQKAYAEGMRALVIYTAMQQDVVTAHKLSGVANGELPAEVAMAERVNDLLLPIVKGVGSERAWVLLGTETLQTFGGSGFLQDYPIEQYVRDAKIDTLYEGTTAIQGQDFFFRKIVKDGGVALGKVSEEITATITSGPDALGPQRQALGKALEDVGAMIGAMTNDLMASDPRSGGDMNNIYKVGQQTTRLLLAAGDVVIAWLLLREAAVALEALDRGPANDSERDFYTGKVASAKFFVANVLPRLSSELAIVQATDNSLMEIPEGAF